VNACARSQTSTRAIPAAGQQVPLTIACAGGASVIVTAACADKVARGYQNVLVKLYGQIQGNDTTPLEVCLGVQRLPPFLSFNAAVDNAGDVVLAWSGGYFDGYRAEMKIIDPLGQDVAITTWGIRSYEHTAAARPCCGLSRWQTGALLVATGATSLTLLNADPARRRLLLTQDGPAPNLVFVTETLGQANGLGIPLASGAGVALELRHTEPVFVSSSGPAASVNVRWSVERQ